VLAATEWVPGRRRDDARRLAGEGAGKGPKLRTLLKLLLEQGEERERPRLGDRREEERRAELMALAPGAGAVVVGVAAGLGAKAPPRHRPEIDLEQTHQSPPISIFEFDPGIGGDRSSTPTERLKRLARLALTGEADELGVGGQPSRSS
jgi:hypothetical protein